MASIKNSRKIYVSNISRDARERDIVRLFEKVGRIVKIQLKQNFAFIEFDSSFSAENAIRKYHGMEFWGRRLVVEIYSYRGGDPRYRPILRNGGGKYRVSVADLDVMTSWQDLKDFGRKAGKSVIFADVYTDRGKKYGVIEYYNYEDSINAVKFLDSSRLNGKKVRVYYSENSGGYNNNNNNRDRDRSYDRDYNNSKRSRDRDRHRSRTRSRSRNRSRDKHRERHRDRDRDRDRNRDKDRDRDRNKNKKNNDDDESNDDNNSNNNKDISKDDDDDIDDEIKENGNGSDIDGELKDVNDRNSEDESPSITDGAESANIKNGDEDKDDNSRSGSVDSN